MVLRSVGINFRRNRSTPTHRLFYDTVTLTDYAIWTRFVIAVRTVVVHHGHLLLLLSGAEIRAIITIATIVTISNLPLVYCCLLLLLLVVILSLIRNVKITVWIGIMLVHDLITIRIHCGWYWRIMFHCMVLISSFMSIGLTLSKRV